MISFKTKIINPGRKPFFTFPAKPRKESGISINDIVHFRISKNDRYGNFVNRIGKWGKVNVPSSITRKMKLKNHDLISIKILNRESKIKSFKRKDIIDLSEIKGFHDIHFLGQNGTLILWKKYNRELIMPRLVKISPNFVKMMYLIFGDGHFKTKLFFTNHRWRIIDLVLEEFYRSLNIPRDSWRCRLTVNIAYPNPKNFWKKILNLEEEQFHPNISRTEYNTQKQGIIRIINSTLLTHIFSFLMNNINQKLSRVNAVYALDGLLNAEGNVLLGSEGIHRVTISFNESEKELFKMILKKSNSECVFQEKEDRLTISKWKNIYEFLKSFVEFNSIPFSLRPQDAFNLISGFLNHRRTKALKNYLETMSKYPNQPFLSIAKLSNRHNKSTRVTLLVRCKEFVNARMKNHKRLILISKEGKTLLNLIKQLEKWLPPLKKLCDEDLSILKELEVN